MHRAVDRPPSRSLVAVPILALAALALVASGGPGTAVAKRAVKAKPVKPPIHLVKQAKRAHLRNLKTGKLRAQRRSLPMRARGTRAFAASAYSFTMTRPMARCLPNYWGKMFTVYAPIAYSGNGGAQWIYWRGYAVDTVYNRYTGFGNWQSAIGYPNSPAPFSAQEGIAGNANLGSVGAEVWWYLGNNQWRSAYWYPLPVTYRDTFGTSFTRSAC
jgi:hypothetical protein